MFIVSILKALQTKNGEILTDIEENDANISTDRDIVDQLELVNQRFVQEAEQTNRKWGTRLKAMQQELEQHVRKIIIRSELMSDIKYELFLFILGERSTESRKNRE